MMHSNLQGDWFCGPGGIFSSFHFGGLFHLVIWGIGLFLLYTLIRHLIAGNKDNLSTHSNNSQSISILEKRYAAGEIGQEEFLQKKKDLTS